MESLDHILRVFANKRNVCCGLDLMEQLPDEVFSLAFFDPQYRSVLNRFNASNKGSRKKKRFFLREMSSEIISSFMCQIDRLLKPSGHLFFWVDKHLLFEGIYNEWIFERQLRVVDMLVWDKGNSGMSYRGRRRFEFCLVLQKKPLIAKGIWINRSFPDVFYEKLNKKIHVQEKPILFISNMILSLTRREDLVLDPAAGSFNVMKACMSLDRHFVGCDIN